MSRISLFPHEAILHFDPKSHHLYYREAGEKQRTAGVLVGGADAPEGSPVPYRLIVISFAGMTSSEDSTACSRANVLNRDPFDHLLIAQSHIEDLTLVSNEALSDRFGIRWFW